MLRPPTGARATRDCRSPRLASGLMALPRPTERTGPLEGHVKRGRRFMTPLAASGALTISDWLRDDLPDLLWPVLVLSELGNNQAVRFVRWQGAVLADLKDEANIQFIAECLDGRLTGLQQLASAVPRARAVITTEAARRGLLSAGVRHALSAYPLRPADWLTDMQVQPPGVPQVNRLAKAVLEVLKDGHRESLIKCLGTWSAVQAGTFRSSQQTIDLLKDYPNDAATQSMADSAIRAMWGAHRSLLVAEDPEHFAESIRWAKVFWGANSMTTRCLRRRDVDKLNAHERLIDANEPHDEAEPQAQPGELQPGDFQQRAMDLMSSYVEAVETSPSRLYDPERQEVHTGLVARAGREVITALGNPDLWCSEHGSHVGRTLVENRILLAWMAQQDQATIYHKYQDYGAGKAKLYTRLLANLPDHWFIDGVEDAVATLQRASHNNDILDSRAVDLSATFAEGKSLRVMADECNLGALYRHAYQMESGVAHSEWWSVEIHCMERCLNVLHRGHLIPSLSLSAGGNPDIARSWLIALHGLIRASLDILAVPKEALQEAFGWLENSPAPEEAWERAAAPDRDEADVPGGDQ